MARQRGRPRSVPPGFDVLVARLRGHGLNVHAIASVLKVDPATVKRALRRSGPDELTDLTKAVESFRRRDGHFEEHENALCDGRCLALRKALGEKS